LEAFSPEYKNATDFLIAIAEPVSRPSHIHEYKLTKYSLYAAASVGLTDTDIEKVLDRFCKNRQIPPDVLDFIKLHCSSYGKAKIVLKSNQYFIESNDRETMNRLISFPAVAQGIRNAQYEQEKARIAEEESKNIDVANFDLSKYSGLDEATILER